jgi:hypothetical protein
VGDPGRYHDNIAGAQLDGRPALAAEANANAAGGDAEDLVSSAVIMVVREDPVAPAPGPVVRRKQRFAGCGGAGTGLDHTAVNNEWERWVVGHAAVISEKVLLDRRGAGRFRMR